MKLSLIATALLLWAATAFAHDVQVGSLIVSHPYARPTGPAQPVGGGYLKIINRGAADRLLSASTAVAASVQMHTMGMEGDVMRMREVAAVDVPAGATVELKPGGLHLMLVGLTAPLEPGRSFPLKLKFEKAGAVVVEMEVDAAGGAVMRHEKAK